MLAVILEPLLKKTRLMFEFHGHIKSNTNENQK